MIRTFRSQNELFNDENRNFHSKSEEWRVKKFFFSGCREGGKIYEEKMFFSCDNVVLRENEAEGKNRMIDVSTMISHNLFVIHNVYPH
jgi:hypothetical protein